MGALLALAMAASICMVSAGALVAIAIFWVADHRGRRRPGRHIGRRTRPSSRGRHPYRSGRVRV